MAQGLGGRGGALAALAEGHALQVFAAIVLTSVLASTTVRARDDYPSRPVQMIIPFSAGGPTDIVGRVMGAKMGELLGQQFVVENKTGAGGNIGAEAVAKATPDGYTILMATVSTNAINPGLYKHIPYDAVHDFAPLGRVGVTPTLLLVHPSIPATDVKSLIALIKANPGKYNYGSSGTRFDSSSVRRVGGQIAMAFDATPTAMPLAKSGKLRALGAGMAKRVAAMPDLPTLQEQGLPGFECYTWNVLLAPAGTPTIVDKLNAAINKSLADPAVSSALEKAGINPTPGSTPENTGEFVRAELAKWAPIIKASGAEID